MKTTNFNRTRVLRTLVALMVIFAMLLCGCTGTDGNGDNGGNGSNNGGSNNGNVMGGDGDGKLESEDVVGSVTGVYGTLLEAIGGKNDMLTNGGVSMDMTITLGDLLMDNLAASLEQAEADVDISWFESVGIVMDVLYNETLTQMNMTAQLNGTDIVSMEAIMDLLSSSVYLRAPELNSQYVGGVMDTGMDTEEMMEQYNQMQAMLEEYSDIVNVLPTEAELNALINRYLDTAKGAMAAPATGSETLSYGGLSQTVTATTYTINRTEILNILEAVATTAKNDAELEKIMDNLAAWVTEKMAAQEPGFEAEDVHAQMVESIDQFLEQVGELRGELENGEVEDVAMLVYTAYTVDEKLTGVKLATNDGWDTMEMYAFWLEQDGKTALSVNVGGQVQVGGTGTVSGSKISGTYTLQADGEEMLYVTLVDFDKDALKKGELVGTLQLRFNEEMNIHTPIGALGSEMMVELVLNMTGSKRSLNMNLYNGSDFLFGVKLNTKMLSGNISVPSSFSNIEDGEAMQNWLSGLSFDTVLSNLRKAGVASDLVDMLQTAIEQNMDF